MRQRARRIDPIVFFGTPSFAVPTLAALEAAGRVPALVVSQPARPAGRGRELRQPPVARWAKSRGIELVQPEQVREEPFLSLVEELGPALAVVAAFGQIFPAALLEIPDHGCLNVHASLLPAYRGAAPVQRAIAEGETETGVTIMRMDEGLDTGPILLQQRTGIRGRETAGELAARLAHLGAAALLEAVAGLEADGLAERPQDDSRASHARRLERRDGAVDWERPASAIFDQLRAVTPWPGLKTTIEGETVRIHWAEPVDREVPEVAAGTFLGIEDGRLEVACGDGTVLGLTRLQRPGGRELDAVDVANGLRLEPGIRFGSLFGESDESVQSVESGRSG